MELPFAGYSVVRRSLNRSRRDFMRDGMRRPQKSRGREHPALGWRSAASRSPECSPVVIGAGPHPFPFRTRKLSLLPPMVLQPQGCGRVGRCRELFRTRPRRLDDVSGVRAYSDSESHLPGAAGKRGRRRPAQAPPVAGAPGEPAGIGSTAVTRGWTTAVTGRARDELNLPPRRTYWVLERGGPRCPCSRSPEPSAPFGSS